MNLNYDYDRNYVPYKEIAAYSVGGAGVYFITAIVGMIGLSAGSMIVGASIGITAMDLQTMNVITTLIMLLIAPTRAMLFDNTKSKMGKFRPYILTLGLPTAVIGTVFVYLPYETMEYKEKLVAVFVCYTLLQFFSPFYSSAYAGLVQVMSANSKERSWIIEISSIIYSFAPTVINPVMPLIGPLDNINTYRIGFPIFCTIGIFVSMLCVFGTKERVIVPKQYVQKMNFFEGLKKVSHNKYFWIINISQWFAFLNQGYGYEVYKEGSDVLVHYNLGNESKYAVVKNINIEIAQINGMNINMVGVLAGEIWLSCNRFLLWCYGRLCLISCHQLCFCGEFIQAKSAFFASQEIMLCKTITVGAVCKRKVEHLCICHRLL